MKQIVKPEFPKELVKYFAILIFGIIALFYFSVFVKINLRTIVVLFVFVAMGAVSRLPERMGRSLGIELCTLVTIVSSVMYGAVAGIFVGVLSLLVSGFYTREPPQDLLVAVVGFVFIGYFSAGIYSFVGQSFAITGLIVTLLYDLGTSLVYIFIGHSFLNCLRFSIVHIPSNYLILGYLGVKLAGI